MLYPILLRKIPNSELVNAVPLSDTKISDSPCDSKMVLNTEIVL